MNLLDCVPATLATNKNPDAKFEQQLIKAGIGIAPGHPCFDPLWMEASKFAERQRVRKVYEIWESPGTVWDESDTRVQLDSGEWITAPALRRRLDRKAYEMLANRADVRTVVVACHMTFEEVEELKTRHKIK